MLDHSIFPLACISFVFCMKLQIQYGWLTQSDPTIHQVKGNSCIILFRKIFSFYPFNYSNITLFFILFSAFRDIYAYEIVI